MERGARHGARGSAAGVPCLRERLGDEKPSSASGLCCADGTAGAAARPGAMQRHGFWVPPESAGVQSARTRPQCQSSGGPARGDHVRSAPRAISDAGRAANVAGGALPGRQGRAAQLRRRGNLIARQGIWIAVLCMLQGTPRCKATRMLRFVLRMFCSPT